MSFYRTCRAAQVQIRGFTSSATRRRVGPESPNYVDVPQPIQPDLPSKKQVKGTLPVPREIFPRRRPDKPTEAYISSATPLPTKEQTTTVDPHDPQTTHVEWKKKMADSRRQNFREGLVELYDRKQETDKFMMRRSYAKQRRREEVLNQPEREDERLTRPSVVQEMLPKRGAGGVLPDPEREARLAASRSKVEKAQLNERVEREDSVHTLYMNARNFITTEAQLAAEIERVFPDGENEAWLNDQQYGESVWNLGVPTSVQSTVTEAKRNETARWDLIQKRVKKLGEALTGGKI